jgi:stress-induced morphogen
MNINEIKKRLLTEFPKDKIEVFDSKGTGDHFSVIVISNKFFSIPLVDRHRMIYSIFNDKIVKEIHAMQIQTYTYEEWKNKNISN